MNDYEKILILIDFNRICSKKYVNKEGKYKWQMNKIQYHKIKEQRVNKEKLQKKDGKASGKSRKQKKYIKEILEELLLMDLPECKLNEDMQKLKIAEDNMSIQMAMCVMLVKQAISGNLKAYQLIRDQIQQNPKDRRR